MDMKFLIHFNFLVLLRITYYLGEYSVLVYILSSLALVFNIHSALEYILPSGFQDHQPVYGLAVYTPTQCPQIVQLLAVGATQICNTKLLNEEVYCATKSCVVKCTSFTCKMEYQHCPKSTLIANRTSHQTTFNYIALLLYILTSVLVQAPKCWQKVLCPLKTLEKAYLDQSLECAAPKRWSKYTTLSTTKTL